MGTQSADRMVGEPTTPTQFYFDAFRKVAGQVVDATPALNEARAIKTAQEIERMRLANELAALAMEYTREHMRPGMKESEVGGMYEGFVHGFGVGYQGKVEMARAFTLVWSGKVSRLLRLRVTGRFRRMNRHFLKSGCAWTATGLTSPRMPAPATSRRSITNCLICCSRSLTKELPTRATAQVFLISIV